MLVTVLAIWDPLKKTTYIVLGLLVFYPSDEDVGNTHLQVPETDVRAPCTLQSMMGLITLVLKRVKVTCPRPPGQPS